MRYSARHAQDLDKWYLLLLLPPFLPFFRRGSSQRKAFPMINIVYRSLIYRYLCCKVRSGLSLPAVSEAPPKAAAGGAQLFPPGESGGRDGEGGLSLG